MSPSAYVDAYKSVRKVLSSSVNNTNKFCNILSHLTNDKPKRLILNSSDSLFDGINLQETLEDKRAKYKFALAISLAKVPRAFFLPKYLQNDPKSSNLPTLLESTLNKIDNIDKYHAKFHLFLTQLRETTQYLSDNHLQDSYGPLRPFLTDYLKRYQEYLINSTSLKKSKKLHFCLTLLDVLKCFSIDSPELLHTVKSMLKDSPELIKNVQFETFRYISRLGLERDANILFNERIKSIAYEDLSTIIKHLPVVFNKFDRKEDLETYLCAVIHKIKIESCTKQQLIDLLRSLKILGNRHKDEELTHLTNTLLELIYPKLSKHFLSAPLASNRALKASTELNLSNDSPESTATHQPDQSLSAEESNPTPIPSSSSTQDSNNLAETDTSDQSIDKSDLLLIFETYLKVNTKSTLIKNCHECLVNFVLDNKCEFTPVELIRIIYNLNANSSNLSKVLVRNEYSDANEVTNRLVTHLLGQFKALDLNDLCLVLYSFSLDSYFKLYHILSNYPLSSSRSPSPTDFDEVRRTLTGIVRRRIVQNLDDSANNAIYSKYIADSSLFKDNELNEYFDSDMAQIIQSLSKNQLLDIITSNNNNRKLNSEVLNGILTKMNDKLDNVNKLDLLNNLVENNRLVKLNPVISNRLFSTLLYKLINTKNGYTQLLQSVQHMPKESDTLMINIIMQYLNRYILHLSIYDVELVLQCANKFNFFHPNLLPLLNYSYDLNIANTQNQVIINMLTCLKNLRIRHEPVIKKFTDRLLNNFKNSSNYYINDLISVNEALSSLCIPYNDLYIYLLNYLSVNALAEAESTGKSNDYKNVNNFHNLSLKDKINLVYSIANFGIVDHNLKTLYLSVINELYKDESSESESHRDEGEGAEAPKTDKLNDSETLLKLYEVHIDLVLNNIYNDEADKISKKLKYPSSLWFTRQELKSQNFKKSNTYITVKDALDSLNVKFESTVTEIYFCNFLIKDGDKSTVIYVVPNEDVLRFWTTSLDTKSLESTANLSIGSSQKIVRNMKLLGYQVIELQQARWDSLQADRTKYLSELLGSN